MKINFRKSLKLIVLLITSLLIATVSAAAYVTLQWTMTATVVANPKVCFIQWSNGSKQNTFTYSVNIFPSIKTVDENITYGVENWDTVSHSCSMHLLSTNATTSYVTSINVTVYNATAQIFTKAWTSFPDTTWTDFTPYPCNYTMWIEIQCAGTATVGNAVTFTFEMKVESP